MDYCVWLTDSLRNAAQRRLRSAKKPSAVELWQGLATGGLRVTLPSEAQWEAAARGSEGRNYPWGSEEPTSEHANFDGNLGGSTSVGLFSRGRGQLNIEDLAGNVFEWCLDSWDEVAYPKRDGSVDPISFDGMEKANRVVRGGSWWIPSRYLRAAYRFRNWSRRRSGNLGFRVVVCRFPEP